MIGLTDSIAGKKRAGKMLTEFPALFYLWCKGGNHLHIRTILKGEKFMIGIIAVAIVIAIVSILFAFACCKVAHDADERCKSFHNNK